MRELDLGMFSILVRSISHEYEVLNRDWLEFISELLRTYEAPWSFIHI